jgi:hypothetical protein
MKKSFVLIAAIVAVVGLGAAVAVAKETTNVGTKVTQVEWTADPDDPATGSFSGRVKAKKGCQKGRKVTVSDGFNKVASDTSNDRGEYKVHYSLAGSGGGIFFARAQKKITENNGDKIVCKKSKRVAVEVP